MGQDSGTLADTFSNRTLQSSSTVYQGRIWDIVSDTFSLTPEAQPITRDYMAHPGAVAVVVLNEQNQVLLLSQYRHPVQMVLWEIPAGLLDVEGENFVVGAARELAEEADLVAAQWHVLTDYFTTPGSSSEAIRIYLARGISEVPENERHVRTDEEAEITFAWVDLDEAADAVLAGRIHNPSAVVGILAAAQASRNGFSQLRDANAPWPEHPAQRGQ
ncbi:ADP-ribose pyrophosphatase [Arthrobacter alpinus]|uniref:ADP-ribose pyrophosphatase n=1 Tax=Arthrobacter alpinus TaxID=656366 RepID=A0A0S2M1Z9_9MICC|nr:NUDIX hydrolase [Arthrobacter alpinus]ALO67504.1 ADP-ribose pyrophosphatase [Arthrobacter alpinus]